MAPVLDFLDLVINYHCIRSDSARSNLKMNEHAKKTDPTGKQML